MKVKFGRIIEGFSLLPCININWIRVENKTYHDVQFAWLFWYITIGQISKYLSERNYI